MDLLLNLEADGREQVILSEQLITSGRSYWSDALHISAGVIGGGTTKISKSGSA
jgi:hypothetical protein